MVMVNVLIHVIRGLTEINVMMIGLSIANALINHLGKSRTTAVEHVTFVPVSNMFQNRLATTCYNIIESLRSAFTLCLYKHHLFQDVMIGSLHVVTEKENASMAASDVTRSLAIVMQAIVVI